MKKILIIEDSPTQSLRLKITLEKEGFEVEAASNGDEGFKKFNESNYDLVITDVIMPGLSGYDFCVKAKEHAEKSKTPVILLTSLHDPMDVIHALECGADNFITKPWQDEILLKRVKSVIENRESREKLSNANMGFGIFMGKQVRVSSSKDQILDLLLSTYEDIVRTNTWLRESQAELERTVALLLKERERSDDLLLNILPRSIADRLKGQTQIIADNFQDATILFVDIVGFSDFASKKTPQEVIQFLNSVFSRFDKLVDVYGLEKIKTIGDSYMVVGGIPTPREDHARAIAHFALDIQKEVENYNMESNSNVSIRIGINTGPVIAGVIGTKKFLYDLWGDAVNIASRMESQGVPNTIQVSSACFEQLNKDFVLEKRGPVILKGKGEMITYFLKGRKEKIPTKEEIKKKQFVSVPKKVSMS